MDALLALTKEGLTDIGCVQRLLDRFLCTSLVRESVTRQFISTSAFQLLNTSCRTVSDPTRRKGS